uniref:Uncharacterized protein n=1 Tax=Aplanochytrium stocchinoi TaxID=215587 RepID=A0A7S3PA90_9STRA
MTYLLRKTSAGVYSGENAFSRPSGSFSNQLSKNGELVPRRVSMVEGHISVVQKLERRYYRVIRVVRNTAIHMCICFTILIVSSLVFSLADLKYSNGDGDGWREVANPDNLISYVRVCYLLLQTALVYGEAIMCAYFVLSILKGRSWNSSARSI